MKNAKKGFTLVEMLIVVAIIAILVAITIPVLNGQLERAREAADAANLRAAYAEASIKALESGTSGSAEPVIITQKTEKWETEIKIAGVDLKTTTGAIGIVDEKDSVVVGVDAAGKVSFTVTRN